MRVARYFHRPGPETVPPSIREWEVRLGPVEASFRLPRPKPWPSRWRCSLHVAIVKPRDWLDKEEGSSS